VTVGSTEPLRHSVSDRRYHIGVEAAVLVNRSAEFGIGEAGGRRTEYHITTLIIRSGIFNFRIFGA
jgi:hypothetical protein